MQSKFKIFISCIKLLLFVEVISFFYWAPLVLGQEFKSYRHPSDNALMVKIPEGFFVMGSDQYSEEKPCQKIFIDSYWIDEYPVTNGQFQKFVETSGYNTDAQREGWGLIRIGRRLKKVEGANWKMPDGLNSIQGKDDDPVTQISYNDVMAYCRWAKKNLPTEAQWEKAARGPHSRKYPWGNEKRSDLVASEFAPMEPFSTVRSFYGIRYITSGIKEWCRDWYGTGHRKAKNPTGELSGKEKVVKGFFLTEPEGVRGSKRGRYAPSRSSWDITFRCVCGQIEGIE